VVQYLVDVDRPALDRPVVGELLHAVDERADPVGLVADQPDQGALVLAHALLEQLRRAADPGQRVLDLVGQRRAEPGDRARAAAVDQLVIETVRDRAGVQDHEAMARALSKRRDVQIDQPAQAPVQGQLDAVIGDAVARQLDPPDQIEQRAVVGHEVGQRALLEQRPAGAKQLLGCRIDEHDPKLPIDRQHAAGHRVQDHALEERGRSGRDGGAHAAADRPQRRIFV
jgi:hypothetical protein